ncbi:hypothetical protein DL546_002879 [Coniochaeta pulveracea]|uniref:Thioesterase family protein n=1 Tax=Coniochaeta pulveracea TaxID=177199 RepID=A0A420YGW9_9PEZI|nr:hypothetical protein DL546_002879 [Coniochaeta pulveracea]
MSPVAKQDRVPFSQAISVTPLDKHTYTVTLAPQLAIGTVPNGGYAASTLLSAAKYHLTSRSQPDTIAAQIAFLNRTAIGKAYIVIEDTKPGRTLSVLHATLYQEGLLDHAPWITPGKSKKCLVAYITNTDLQKEAGHSLLTYSLPSPPPPVNLSALAKNEDRHWHKMPLDGHAFGRVKALSNMEYHVLRSPPAPTDPTIDPRSTIDLWVRLSDLEGYRPPPPAEKPFRFDQVFWYPTVALNLEVKKPLPEEGVEWLFLRVTAKQIRNGRLDLEVIVLDEKGELVALSTHVNLIVDGARNTAGRGGTQGKL